MYSSNFNMICHTEAMTRKEKQKAKHEMVRSNQQIIRAQIDKNSIGQREMEYCLPSMLEITGLSRYQCTYLRHTYCKMHTYSDIAKMNWWREAFYSRNHEIEIQLENYKGHLAFKLDI